MEKLVKAGRINVDRKEPGLCLGDDSFGIPRVSGYRFAQRQVDIRQREAVDP
jgi:hypothetical protein